tara:strand:- start:4015 stop:4959 length:945 start_codon:yes stop_codon:yes gene_type:complete
MDKNREQHSLLLKNQNNINDLIRLSTSNFSDQNSILSFYKDLFNENNLNYFLNNFKSKKINIVEMCSGSGIYGILLAKLIGLPGKLHLVDIVGSYHKKAKEVATEILGDSFEIITHTCSADHCPIETQSIDLIIEVDGFHHCPSLMKVICESKRILKKNGLLIGIDRIHENHITKDEINEQLDAIYSEQWLLKNNYPKDQKLSRRDNGENELKISEWIECLKINNFQNISLIEYIKFSKRSIKVFLISNFPIYLKRKLFRFCPPVRWGLHFLPTLIFGKRFNFKKKDYSLTTKIIKKSFKANMIRKQVILAKNN